MVFQFLISFYLQRDNREFVLNKTALCSGNRPVLAKITFNNISVDNNIFSVKAVVVIKDNLSKDLTMRLQYKRCKRGMSECFGTLEFPVPNLCALLSSKTIFGNGLGSSFTPTMVCPIKKGSYNGDVKLDLNGIAAIPLDRILYDTNLDVFDVGKNKEITCLNFIMWMKHVKN